MHSREGIAIGQLRGPLLRLGEGAAKVGIGKMDRHWVFPYSVVRDNFACHSATCAGPAFHTSVSVVEALHATEDDEGMG